MTAIGRVFKSAAFRLSLAYLLIFMTIAGLAILFIFSRTNSLLTEQVMQTIGAEVKGLREQYRVGGVGLLKSTIDGRSLRPGSNMYYLSDRRGVRIAGNLNRIPAALTDQAGGGLFRYTRISHKGSEKRQAVGIVLQVTPDVRLIVGRDIEDQVSFTKSSRRIFIWGFSLLALVGVAGGFLVSRHILGRIETVNAAAQTIMAGDLSGRIPVKGSGDELDRLSENLNAMLERIEQLMNGLREVSDNIAHDLKTPLSRLRNRVEGALRDSQGESHYRDVLERTIEESDELIKTFNALLSIARLEAGAVAKEFQSVSLEEILSDVAELYEPLVEDEGKSIKLSVESDATVFGDRQLIGQALANLVENALKYGTQGGTSDKTPGKGDADIRILLKQAGAFAEIHVVDRGPGIPASERARVLKRFVRLEDSRSMPGSGLGLSLVAAVARLHGGEVRLDDAKPGLEVVLAIPLEHDMANNGKHGNR